MTITLTRAEEIVSKIYTRLLFETSDRDLRGPKGDILIQIGNAWADIRAERIAEENRQRLITRLNRQRFNRKEGFE